MPATSAEKHLSTYLIETDIKIQTTQVLQVKLSFNILPANLYYTVYIIFCMNWQIWITYCVCFKFSGEERPYNCELCKKGFLGKTHLITHFRRYHHDLGAHQIDTLLTFMLKTERFKPS